MSGWGLPSVVTSYSESESSPCILYQQVPHSGLELSQRPDHIHPSAVGTFWEVFDKCLYVCMLSCCSQVQLCDPMDYSPPGSSVHVILQQEYWCELPNPSPGDLPKPAIEPTFPAAPSFQEDFFFLTAEPLEKTW